MKGRGIAVALGLGAIGTLALMTGRRRPHAKDPAFAEPMVPPPPGPPSEHPPTITPVSYDDARDWLAWAYSAETGELPSVAELAMLLAHSALETGSWAKLRGFNFGNITALGRDRPYFVLRGVTEYVGGKPVVVDMVFRWYPTVTLGAWDFVHTLRKTFTAAWSVLGSSDASAYANALADQHYYTGPRDAYADGLGKLFAEFVRRELARPGA
jgi:hypothetical protein